MSSQRGADREPARLRLRDLLEALNTVLHALERRRKIFVVADMVNPARLEAPRILMSW